MTNLFFVLVGDDRRWGQRRQHQRQMNTRPTLRSHHLLRQRSQRSYLFRIISRIIYIGQKLTYTCLNKCNLATQLRIQDFILGCSKIYIAN